MSDRGGYDRDERGPPRSRSRSPPREDRRPPPRSRSRSRSRSPAYRRSRSRSPRGGGEGGFVKGTALRWNERGFGFIKPDDNSEDVFCHVSAIRDGDSLAEGAAVEFKKTYDDRKGKYRAEEVTGGCESGGGRGGPPPRDDYGGGYDRDRGGDRGYDRDRGGGYGDRDRGGGGGGYGDRDRDRGGDRGYDRDRGGGGGGGGGGREDNENKLFIGGLAWATNDDNLYRAFDRFRPTSARVVMDRDDPGRSRGFGFVCFANRSDADAAKADMDGRDLDGRAVRIDFAGAPPGGGGGGGGGRY